MKKLLLILLTIALTFGCLAGFSSQKTVPDRMLEWAIEDYLRELSFGSGDTPDCKPTFRHAPDKKTNTDTVSIDLLLEYSNMIASAHYEATYQYDKTSEIWTVIRGGKWDKLKVTRCVVDPSRNLWGKALQDAGLKADLVMAGKDAAASCSTLVEAVSEHVEDSWYMEVDRYSIQVMNVVMDTQEEAIGLYERFVADDSTENTLYVYDSGEGENFGYTIYEGMSGDQSYHVFIWNDSAVYVILSDHDDTRTLTGLKQVLQTAGFVI